MQSCAELMLSNPPSETFNILSSAMAQISYSSEEKPTIVVVQGSFQTALVYEALEKGLQSQGYPTIHPTLPSCSNIDSPTFPSITLLDDAVTIRREVGRVVEETKTVVLVMHSYGGLVGSEAIPEEMTYPSRQ